MNLSQKVHAYLANVYKVRLRQAYIELTMKNETKLKNLEKKLERGAIQLSKFTSDKNHMAWREQVAANRINDNEMVDVELYGIKFEECTDEKLLGLAKVFCDRKTMYYHPDIKNMDEEKAVCAVLCAFFNSQQDYATLTRLNESRKQITAYQSALAMYHIGVITEKLWYCNARHRMAERMAAERPQIFEKYQIHEPNQMQSDHMILQAIATKDSIYGNVDDSYTTGDAIEARVQLTYWDVKEPKIRKCITHQDDVITTYFVINEDGSKTRVQWNKKELKVHKDVTELAKEMVKSAAAF